MRLKFFGLVVMVLIALGGGKNQSDDDEKIYAKVINASVYATPPPPPPKLKNKGGIPKHLIDSVLNNPIRILVAKYKLEIYPKKDESFNFNNELEIFESDIPVEPHLLKPRKSITFDLVETPINEFDPKEYEGLLSLSRIHYNDLNDKAIVVVSFSRGKLSGFMTAFLLELIKNEWIIVDQKDLWVS
ncbi:MAG: hypothetical protein ACON5F_01775 [Jejuia sp.]